MAERLRDKSIIGYGLGEIANHLLFAMGASYLLLYYTRIAGLSLVAAGSIIIIVHIVSIMLDIVIGHSIDKLRSHLGKYRPFLLFGPIPLLLSLALLFSVPQDWTQDYKIIYSACSYSFFVLCYSLISISYGALAATITKNPYSRIDLGVSRMIAASFAYLGLYLLEHLFVATNFSLFFVLGIIGLLSYTLYFCCFNSIREQTVHIEAEPKGIKSYNSLLHNRPLWILCAASLGLLTANFSMNAAFVLYVQHQFQFYEQTFISYLITIQMALNVLGAIVIHYVAQSIDKKKIFFIGCSLALLGCIILLFLASAQSFTGLFSLAVACLGFGLAQTVMWSFEADTVEYGEIHNNIRTAGLNYACFSVTRKIAQLLSNTLPLYIFTIFVVDTSADSPANLASYLSGAELNDFILIMMSVFPAIAIIFSIGAMYFYPINDAYYIQLRQELRKRYHALATNKNNLSISEITPSTNDDKIEQNQDPFPSITTIESAPTTVAAQTQTSDSFTAKSSTASVLALPLPDDRYKDLADTQSPNDTQQESPANTIVPDNVATNTTSTAHDTVFSEETALNKNNDIVVTKTSTLKEDLANDKNNGDSDTASTNDKLTDSLAKGHNVTSADLNAVDVVNDPTTSTCAHSQLYRMPVEHEDGQQLAYPEAHQAEAQDMAQAKFIAECREQAKEFGIDPDKDTAFITKGDKITTADIMALFEDTPDVDDVCQKSPDNEATNTTSTAHDTVFSEETALNKNNDIVVTKTSTLKEELANDKNNGDSDTASTNDKLTDFLAKGHSVTSADLEASVEDTPNINDIRQKSPDNEATNTTSTAHDTVFSEETALNKNNNIVITKTNTLREIGSIVQKSTDYYAPIENTVDQEEYGPLSVLQILSLLNLPKIGPVTLLKIADFFTAYLARPSYLTCSKKTFPKLFRNSKAMALEYGKKPSKKLNIA